MRGLIFVTPEMKIGGALGPHLGWVHPLEFRP
jgi:hypothetical protein